jgi:hypothetical protein
MTLLLLLGLMTGMLTWEIPVEYVLKVGQTTPDPLPRCVDVEGQDPPVTKCLDQINIFHGMEVEISPGVMGYELDQVAVVDETVLSFEVVETVPGKWFYAVTAVDREGAESAESGHVSKVLTDDVPLPPVILPQEEPVFTVKMQPDVFLLFNVGTVPAGTECFLDRGAPAGYGVVPFVDVVWTDPLGPRPIAVVTLCD